MDLKISRGGVSFKAKKVLKRVMDLTYYKGAIKADIFVGLKFHKSFILQLFLSLIIRRLCDISKVTIFQASIFEIFTDLGIHQNLC